MERPPLEGRAFWPRLRGVLRDLPRQATCPPEGARVGAVLALFEDTEAGPGVVLTRRRRDLRSHPGQVSFPGGRVDEGESAEAAALREASEEIGLRSETVEVLGTGPTSFIPPSRIWVVPAIGRWVQPHDLAPNPWEVEEVLRLPLTSLLEESRWRWVPLPDRGVVWAWQLDDDLLWGATALMIATLLDLVLPNWSGGRQPEDLGRDRLVLPWSDHPLPEPLTRLGGIPEVPFPAVPVITADQARHLERLLADDVRVQVNQLLERVGRAVTHAVRRLGGGDLQSVPVTVLVGPGGNGTAGLAAARLLAAAGALVRACTVGAPRLPDQVEGLRAVDVPVVPFDPAEVPGDAVVDALLGVGTDPPVRGGVAAAVHWLRRHDVPVVSLDLPSGLHPDAGLRGPCVSADVTIALGAPKLAVTFRIARPYVGDLYLADLGIPAAVWRKAGLQPAHVFGRGPLVRLVDVPQRDPSVADLPPGSVPPHRCAP